MNILNNFALSFFVFGEAVKYWKRKKIKFPCDEQAFTKTLKSMRKGMMNGSVQ